MYFWQNWIKLWQESTIKFMGGESEELFQPEFAFVLIRYRGCFLAPLLEWSAFPFYRLELTDSIAYRILKRQSHLTIKLDTRKGEQDS